jgi:transcription antitermination factor NusG
MKQKNLAQQAAVAEGAKLQPMGLSQDLPQEQMINEADSEGGLGLNWYALYTCPRHEKSVAHQIEQRSIACFLPVYRSMRRWKDRRKEIELALFPGYVFVHLALRDRIRVLQLPSAVRLVSFNGHPAVLPDAEIDGLRQRVSRGACVEPHPYLRVGRRVRVCGGPMQGLEGIIVRRKDRCRVVFSLDLIMRSMAVEVDESDLEPITESQPRI